MEYVIIYHDWPEVTMDLTLAEKGMLMDAIVAYSRGEEPDLAALGNMIYPYRFLQNRVDKSKFRYRKKCEQNAINARKGARKLA